jgi:uncharacterized protein YjbI with pentapeptide repeats
MSGTPLDRDDFDGETIADIDASGLDLAEKSFRRCRLERVRLTEASLRAATFEDCDVVQCDWTLAVVKNAAFRDVRFVQSKLMGVDWSSVKRLTFVVRFERCILTHASFVGNKLRGTRFVDCTATEANFVEVDLTEAVFAGTDLAGAKFIDTVLVDADLSEARNYSISPAQNRLRRTRFSEEAALGLVAELGVIVPGR